MSETRLESQQGQYLTQSARQAISLLSMDMDEMTQELSKAVQENPALEYVPPQKSANDYAAMVRTKSGVHGTFEGEGRQVAAKVTAREALEQQVRLEGLDPEVTRIAIDMIHHLTGRGYFPITLSEYALENNVTMEKALAGLEAIQSLGPPGIGARSVSECLELQLHDREHVDPLCYDLIRLYLLEIGKGNYRQIAKETGNTVAHVQACVDVIRGLTPSPCSLSEETTQYIMPEFSIEKEENGQLFIVFHHDYFPSCRIDETFERLSKTLEGSEAEYAQGMLRSANQLIRAIEMRQSTMQRVAAIILREQYAFFLERYSLIPLRCEDVAKELDVHETTVYRAIQNKYLTCARGTFPLSHFFQREVQGGVSVAQVKEMIAEICAKNGKMTDRAIKEELDARGVPISRRTVAKYRAQMDIDSSYGRTR